MTQLMLLASCLLAQYQHADHDSHLQSQVSVTNRVLTVLGTASDNRVQSFLEAGTIHLRVHDLIHWRGELAAQMGEPSTGVYASVNADQTRIRFPKVYPGVAITAAGNGTLEFVGSKRNPDGTLMRITLELSATLTTYDTRELEDIGGIKTVWLAGDVHIVEVDFWAWVTQRHAIPLSELDHDAWFLQRVERFKYYPKSDY